MYQVLIVDDEKEIRDGLACWSWEEMGIKVAGCRAHGLEALQFIGEHPVDIVMTDIRMPFMDGLELMEALNRQFPFVKVVILSGYSDFDYTQRAIQQGAVDYMLKPIVFADLAQAVRRLTARLDEQRQDERRIEALKRRASQLAGVLRSKFLARLFREPLAPDELEQDAAEGEVLLEAHSYTAAVLLPDRLALNAGPGRPSERELKLLVFSIDNILNDIWDGRGCGYHLAARDMSEICLLAKHDGEAGPEEIREMLRDIVRQLLKYIGLFKSTFSVGIGVTVREPADIFRSVRSARRALSGNEAEGAIVAGDEIPPGEDRRPAASADPENEPGPDAEAPDSVILMNARQYVRDNYARSITLKEVADHVYVSKGHLSALFKNINETFLKYLTTIRIDKAKELMSDNEYKIYEIVEMVGYSDPAYFAEVFKRHTGKTPNEYRGKLKAQRGACS